MAGDALVRRPRVCTVVLHWNWSADTVECLRSLQRLDYPHGEILLVDNGSTDDSVARLQGQFPDVHFLCTGRNLGFAGGCNQGIQWALDRGADYVWLLNNDTEVAPDTLSCLLAEAERVPSVGLLSPLILDAAGRSWFDGRRQLAWALAGLGTPGVVEDSPAASAGRDVDFVVGCALLIRREAIEAIGVLDATTFMYSEDIDYCLRARQAGFRLRYVPGARVVHKVSASTRGRRPLYRYYRGRSRAWLLHKHCRLPLPRLLAILYLAAESVWRAAGDVVGHDLRSAPQFGRGVIDGWRGNFGGHGVSR